MTSYGTVRNRCRTATLEAKRSLLFARMLRAIWRANGHSVPPQELLNVVDLRTVAKYMKMGGARESDRLPTLEEFLRHQQIIYNPRAIKEVVILLRVRPEWDQFRLEWKDTGG